MKQEAKKGKTDLLSSERLGEAYARLKYKIFEQMTEIYTVANKKHGLTQSVIAERLGANKALISRRLHGNENLTLKTIAEMFAAMEARLDVKGTLLDEVRRISNEEVRSKYSLPENCFYYFRAHEVGDNEVITEVSIGDNYSKELVRSTHDSSSLLMESVH